MQTIEDTHQEGFISKHILEELSNLGDFSLLPEGRVEEDVSNEVDKLDLHDVLLIQHYLVEHFE
jgi:putative NADPH-quinone reductase